MNLGGEGYLRLAGNVMETSRKIQSGINSLEGLQVISNPDLRPDCIYIRHTRHI